MRGLLRSHPEPNNTIYGTKKQGIDEKEGGGNSDESKNGGNYGYTRWYVFSSSSSSRPRTFLL